MRLSWCQLHKPRYVLISAVALRPVDYGSGKQDPTVGRIRAILAKGRFGAVGTKVHISPVGLECLSGL